MTFTARAASAQIDRSGQRSDQGGEPEDGVSIHVHDAGDLRSAGIAPGAPEVLPAMHHRFVAASDAAEDVPGEGVGGFLLVWCSGVPAHEAFVAVDGS